MPTNKDKDSSKLHPSNIESEDVEARLDALIPTRRPPSRNKSTLPSKLDKALKSSLPSKLDATRDTLPSKLDVSTLRSNLPPQLDKTVKSNLPSKLDNPVKNSLSSKLDSIHRENLPSKLDSGSNEDKIATKTSFTSRYDIEMATRQTKYDSLAPQQKAEQEEWAQQQIMILGPCPEGFRWVRVPGGYNCWGSAHWITDELLAVGKSGFYVLDDEGDYWGKQHGLLNVPPGSMPDFLYAKQAARKIGFSSGLVGFAGPYSTLEEAVEDYNRKNGSSNPQMSGNLPGMFSQYRPSIGFGRGGFGNISRRPGFGGGFSLRR